MLCNAQELAVSFSGGSVRGYEYGLAFVPGEISQKFRSAGEKFLHMVCFQVHNLFSIELQFIRATVYFFCLYFTPLKKNLQAK